MKEIIKVKSSIGKIGKYLREISVVVIGVAITLSASYWLTSRSEKKDLALYLEAIKMELEENIRVLENTNETIIKPGLNYRNYLMSNDKKSLNPDSLKYYMYSTGAIHDASSIMFRTSAFEMLKTSGNMRLVDNKELLISLWNTYSFFGFIMRHFDNVSDMKMEELKKYSFQYSIQPTDEDMLKNPPLYDIHVNFPIPLAMQNSYNAAKMLIHDTLSKFK